MIVAERKPIKQILEMIEPYAKVAIVGCRGCVAICSAGGDREVEILASALRLARKNNGKPLETVEKTFTRQCDPEYLTPLADLKEEVEAVISLACGVGVNLASELYPDLKIYPGVNTTFYGANPALGKWEEMCRGCGDCILDLTGGICPIARCAKNLLNGPCGGSQNGKCEISPDTPCVWQLIYDRLKARGELEKLAQIWAPKNWIPAGYGGPRKRERSDLELNKN
ncbi:methylenetetrahydrofolate reductase C-terminal domain-containing protein [Thermodesulfatator indicus]